jgi:hypothetical protein
MKDRVFKMRSSIKSKRGPQLNFGILGEITAS